MGKNKVDKHWFRLSVLKNDLVNGSIEFYKMNTLDLLIDRKLPDITWI